MSDVARRTATDSFWWPATVTPWVRGLAVASLLTNSLLILTGGLVRLTGSGLGCPTWPRCTADSWTSTQEMGVHGLIEFGNRLLTFVLIAVAIGTFLSAVRHVRAGRLDRRADGVEVLEGRIAEGGAQALVGVGG